MQAGRWLEAARPRTLPAAASPVILGSGLAIGDDVFRWDALLGALIGALAIQVAANFANDASDAARGADSADRIGPVRMVATGEVSARQMWIATWMAVGVAVMAGIWLITIAGWVVALIGVLSIVAMLGYVGGPVPYGYRGLGEVFVFAFFGLVATVGSRYVHDMAAPMDAWLLGIPIGLLATAILVANNYRDIETDERAGKRTLAVILGRRKTRYLYAMCTYLPYLLIAGFATLGWTPTATLIAALVLPLAILANQRLAIATTPPDLISILALTSRLELVTSLSLAVGAAI
ncbi:MAG: 1,4-dihydroxy-2-naphthoate polyprenyltransferase [Acidimicrobiia bacterium]|nr:1,4-dihydroxy-2-naphthoate polyprenyltransferase [Acidimicrobiia bacterium]